MKRFLTTLVILLVVIIAGLSVLVLLVNPNDFRAYMIDKVKDSTGYELSMNEDMRWHVWPKLSIITGKMTLTAPGAKEAVIKADNMRLDVELWPLISHQLSVKEVVLESAVLKVLPETQGEVKKTAPIAPGNQRAKPVNPSVKGNWSLDINKVRIANSLLIWQAKDGSQINMRDINFTVEQAGNGNLVLGLSSNINRNQQELSFSLNANMDISQYPTQVIGNISRLNYRLSGAGVYANGVSGTGTTAFTYHESVGKAPQSIYLENLNFSANESQLTGTVEASLTDIPKYDIQLNSSKLNLDNLLGIERSAEQENGENNVEANKPTATKPVIAAKNTNLDKNTYDLTFFNDVNFIIALNADMMIYSGMEISQLALKAENRDGVVEVSKLGGNVFGGRFSIPLTLYTKSIPAKIRAKPLLQNIDIQPLLKAFKMPENFAGRFSLDADFSGTGYDRNALLSQWSGNAAMTVTDVKLSGLNIPALIKQSIAQVTDKIVMPDDMEPFTEAKKLEADVSLNKSNVNIRKILAVSDSFNITGSGKANLLKEDMDINLGVQILQGWGNVNELVKRLSSIRIPLTLYGNWNNIQYKLDVERLVRDELQQRAKQALNDWLSEDALKAKEREGVKSIIDKL